MPKLRYKEKESSRSEHKSSKHKSSKHKSSKHKPNKTYKPPTLYEEEAGWVPQKHEEDEWRQHLFEVMMDDEGQDPFYSRYEHVQPTPSMTDEEHRQYIVSGMYQRTHKEEIEAEEKRKARKAKKKQEANEAKEKMKKEDEERKRVYNIYNQLEKLKQVEKEKQEYTEKWKRLDTLDVICKKDIPWPIVSREFSFESVRSFLSNSNNAELKKNIRKEQTRYHPDKFITKYIKKFKGSEKEKQGIITHVNEISGWINELWTQLFK
ncbi:hypothetical protein BDF21DRAFT_351833 [Thamnidium elegans]|uniref:Uncharacterized protein n=1 Tax=Thamnidium elegans TaxID=101142 RepID=A0A8H7SM86_9FUNG|nr:hypothetical protein INT48_006361 [Thamnidium elegans]KAI8048216.1 hypothetical protein BDF21DRAFT_351833 [Thamnidium elegans]